VVEAFEHTWLLAGNVGTKLFLSTQKGAARGKMVTVDLADPKPAFIDLIAEREDAVLRFGTLVGDRLIVAYMVDAKTQVERYKLDGTLDGTVELPGIGSAGVFHGRPGDDEAFFVFTSHDAPTRIYRYDGAANARSVWAEPKVAIDLKQIVVEQRFYASKDGRRVPLLLVRRRDVSGPAPTDRWRNRFVTRRRMTPIREFRRRIGTYEARVYHCGLPLGGAADLVAWQI
jgi:prolyl oligopeptidase